jgi:transposase
MTAAQLRDWQMAMGYTQQAAAAALGVSWATYKRWLVAGPTRIAGLACVALLAGLG